ncbi:MAG: GNAT family N-acetyltransferase [Dehalococcoidia bacterium]|nr:GNAT family N-acetyltransferase [Dehalococcoidia bacterium]
MVKKDKPSLVGILKDTPEFKPSEVAVAVEVIDSYLSDPEKSGYYVLVAELGSAVVGYICFGPTPMTECTWDLYWEAVDRKLQGQGIGSTLTRAAEDAIKKADGKLAVIETSSSEGYEKTLRFHFSQGYEINSRITDFYAPGDDRLILLKKLS